MKHRHLHRNQFVSLNEISLDELDEQKPLSRHNTFITQKTLENEEEVRQRHRALEAYLENLEKKVVGIIKHNSNEVLSSYENHLIHVKMELQEFKRHSEAQASSSDSLLQKIDLLEKQLAVFREESLKMFQRVADREKTIEHLRIQLEEMHSEKRHMDALVKQLSKRNRELESQKEQERKHSQTDNYTLEINSFSKNFARNRLNQKSATNPIRPLSQVSKRPLNHTISVDQSFHDFAEGDTISKHLRQKLSLGETEIGQIKQAFLQLLGEEQKKWAMRLGLQKEKDRYDQQTRLTNRSRSIYTADIDHYKHSLELPDPPKQKGSIKQKSQELNNNHELSQYFKKCIETVRKEIGTRKKVNSVSFYKEGAPVTIEDFKKIDFIRLMELICSQESVIVALYNSLVQAKK